MRIFDFIELTLPFRKPLFEPFLSLYPDPIIEFFERNYLTLFIYDMDYADGFIKRIDLFYPKMPIISFNFLIELRELLQELIVKILLVIEAAEKPPTWTGKLTRIDCKVLVSRILSRDWIEIF